MAMRSVLTRASLTRSVVTTRAATRCFSDGKGKVLSEEERAKENVYIQDWKWEKERLEKMKQQSEKLKAEKEKEGAEKKSEGGSNDA